SRKRLVLERADFENGLTGADDFGELALLFLSIRVEDFHRSSDRSCKRMQHHKAGSISEEVGKRRSFSRKFQSSITLCLDFGGIADRLILVTARGLISNDKSMLALADSQVLDCGSISAPILVADDVGNSTQDLFTLIADIAQGAAIEDCREGTCSQFAALAVRCFGSEELDGTAWFPGHGGLLK